MPLWSRLANVFRGERLSREIDEELQSHIEEAIAQGRDPAEARRAFGSALLHREESRDIRILAWLDSLRADTIFAWRQLLKRKVTSPAAILSLALAIGACTAAFRLIDALLLRPLPVAHPERLYSLYHQSFDIDGNARIIYTYEYPMFRQMRVSVRDQAELIAISYPYPMDLTYGDDEDMEKARVQYVSGCMFGSFGLRPTVGRLLSESDDLVLGAHPYAVLSYDYWTRRFGRDPKAVGRTLHMANGIYTIIGVAADGFTGTETGMVTDLFVPTMMNLAVANPSTGWIRVFVQLKPGIAVESVRDRLRTPFRTYREALARGFTGVNPEVRERFLGETLMVEPAAAGLSGMQREYRRPLIALGILVALVLLIACANVANLMTAQAAARAREMALRVSIGAGPWRLVQMVLVESASVAVLASLTGLLFACWTAPFVVSRINSPDDPVRLALPVDWRVLGFALALGLAVTFLFGLAPALRAWAVKPASALKGGEDPNSRRRLMHGLIAAQVAFCFVVLFVAALFVDTSQRLANQPTGFSAERILLLDAVAKRAQPPVYWEQALEALRATPGVERAALAGFPLLFGQADVGSISTDGGPPRKDRAYFLNVSPGWLDAFKIPLSDGRDFRTGDMYPGVAIVNNAFVKQYFGGRNPLGIYFERTEEHKRLQIVGIAGDARYRDMRGPILPVVYVPFDSIDAKGIARPVREATFIVRTIGSNARGLAPVLRREVPRARPEFRVSNIRTQEELVLAQTVRERLLAMLAVFFAVVALLLAGIGLYGVLDYSVLQRRHEIGIRMAIGAQARDIAGRVTADVFRMVLVGVTGGFALGMASVRYIEALLYQVKPGDPRTLALPLFTILAAALLAALPAVVRAVRIDPAESLRSE